jgi:hypothetical protein
MDSTSKAGLSPMALQSTTTTSNLLYISPSQQGPFLQGASVTYQVKVANMSTFNTWDIHVKTNPFALNPTNFTLIPNTLTANDSLFTFELIHCVNGQGTGCDKDDGPGVVHSGILPIGGAPPLFFYTGILFAISYVAGVGNSSAVHIFDDLLSDFGFLVAHTTSDGGYGTNTLPTILTFTALPGSGIAVPVNQTFSATVTDADNDTIGFILDFGDATTMTFGSTDFACAAPCIIGPIPHTYNTTGLFTAKLTINDFRGGSAVANTTVIVGQVVFAQAKLSWIHHVSLARTGGVQSWTATVNNPFLTEIFVQVLIVGAPTTNYAARSPVTAVSPGLSSFSWQTMLSSRLVGLRVCFTASLEFSLAPGSISLTSSETRSGCFSVLP